MTNLGFIGLGIMGKPMAKHLLAKGCHVMVCDINPEPVKECCSVGGVASKSSKDVAQKSDIIFVDKHGDIAQL